MLRNSKAQVRKTSRYPLWFRHLVRYLYGVGLFSMGAAVVLLVVVALTDTLFSKNGLFLMMYILVFLLLLYLKKHFDLDDNK